MTINISGARKVSEKISPDGYEATRRMQESQETTWLFEDINGGRAAGNVYSTREKIAEAMGIEKDGIVRHVMDAMAAPVPPEEVKDPAFAQCELPLDLEALPIVKYFPEDAGRYISAGIVVSEYNGKRNVSFHRMLIRNKKEIGIRLVPRHTFTLFNEAKKDGKDLNIAICIGAPVEAMVAAALSVDFGTDELTIASAMHRNGHGTPLKVAKCRNGLTVPADCEYVIEARITSRTAPEGPFVDIAGTYDEIRDQPVVEVDCIRSKKDPVFQLLLPGGFEHFLLMGVPREPVIFRTVRQAVPKVKNVRLTEGGCCWLNGVVSISKNREGDGVNAIMAAFTGHPSMKNVIIVDDDIDIFDDREVEWAVATRMQADRIIRIPGAGGSSLDPSAHGTTWKTGFDATLPLGADRGPYTKATVPGKKRSVRRHPLGYTEPIPSERTRWFHIGKKTGRTAIITVNTTAIAITARGPTLIPFESSESKYLISPAEEEKPSFFSFATSPPIPPRYITFVRRSYGMLRPGGTVLRPPAVASVSAVTRWRRVPFRPHRSIRS